MIDAHVYKQTYDEITDASVEPHDLFTTITCPDCNGTGEFEITDDDKQPCNECKTKGKLYVSL